MTEARRKQAIRQAKHCWLCWSCFCAIGATIGGIIGMLTWTDDSSI